MTISSRLSGPINRMLARAGLQLVTTASQDAMRVHMLALERQRPSDIRLLRSLRSSDTLRLLELLDESRAQFRQDLFVLSALNFKQDGFFVEFGATNGVKSSNTHLLEVQFGWTGILAEPARSWHADLRRNRKSAIDTRCVWSRSGESVEFVEPEMAGLSTIRAFAACDDQAENRASGRIYEVETVSLDDLLEAWAAPERIDYLSIDTEGSEYEILGAFDFSRRHISVITCEHNHTTKRDEVFRLLSSHGFHRVHEDVSGVDDWFIHRDVLDGFS